LPVDELAPLTLYVTENVEAPKVVEFTFTVAALPRHGLSAVGDVKFVIFGTALTVIGVVAVQPPASVYIIVGLPAETPVTIPVDEPTVA
jgi:hypothetical protein